MWTFRRKKTVEPVPSGALRYPWGGYEFDPNVELAPHYAVMGMTNSGKTLTIRMLMRAVLLEPGHPVPRHRAMVYDPKRDFLPLLVGMGVPEASIVLLHAFDKRAHVWHIAKDVDSRAAARQLAAILAPADKNSTQPFFANAAQDILAGVIDTLRVKTREQPDPQWTLNDVLEALSPRDRLKEFLRQTDDGKDLVDSYFEANPKTLGDILSTLRTKLAPFQDVARIWARIFRDHPERRLSLSEWAVPPEKGPPPPPRVLLLGTDDTNAESLEPINRAMFKRASQLVTARPKENPDDQTWFFLDEVRWLGELDGLQGLLLKGRSKGAHVVLGFQDLQGLKHVYGEFQAEELVAQCGNLAILKLNSPETMEWAARYFGKYRDFVASFGESHSAQGGSTSTQQTPQEVSSILAQQFRLFPLPTEETGITGAFASPDDAWTDTIPPNIVDKFLRRAPLRPLAFDKAPATAQDRVGWRERDRNRLKLDAAIALDPDLGEEQQAKDDPYPATVRGPLPNPR